MGSEMISAEIVCDSVAPSGIRLTTFVLTYPRFIHAEFMTHRMFSRNASSSRAIPVNKQIQMVLDNPVVPLAFTKNQKGMQGGQALTGPDEYAAKKAWIEAMYLAVDQAKILADLQVHKQYANRVLEPYAHITVVCTATDFNNFFALRCHEAAQPEIHVLADLMYAEYNKSIPNKIHNNSWHLPFIGNEELAETRVFCKSNQGFGITRTLIKRSVARCARVSYLNHDGTKSIIEQDVQLYERLVGSAPIHASPAEHQAKAAKDPKKYSGNFRGWVQYRKTLSNENIKQFSKDEAK